MFTITKGDRDFLNEVIRMHSKVFHKKQIFAYGCVLTHS